MKKKGKWNGYKNNNIEVLYGLLKNKTSQRFLFPQVSKLQNYLLALRFVYYTVVYTKARHTEFAKVCWDLQLGIIKYNSPRLEIVDYHNITENL